MLLFFSMEFLFLFLRLIPFWIVAVILTNYWTSYYYKKLEKSIDATINLETSIYAIENCKSKIERTVDFSFRKLLFMRTSVYVYKDFLFVKNYSKLLFKNTYKPFLIKLRDTASNDKKYKYILSNISSDEKVLEIRFNKIYERKSYKISIEIEDEKQLSDFLKCFTYD